MERAKRDHRQFPGGNDSERQQFDDAHSFRGACILSGDNLMKASLKPSAIELFRHAIYKPKHRKKDIKMFETHPTTPPKEQPKPPKEAAPPKEPDKTAADKPETKAAPAAGTAIPGSTTIDALFTTLYATRSGDLGAASYAWATPNSIVATFASGTTPSAQLGSAMFARFEARPQYPSSIRY